MNKKVDTVYDLIVVGGGITGAGAARDAALRGLSVLLLEKGDFSSGVSSKSTRLIHGGLRYLANFELDLVAESLRERAVIRRLVPYLVHPIPIVIPVYRGDAHGRAAISIGIHLYELLSREKDIPHYFTCGAEKALLMEPRLAREGLKGCAVFYDHQITMPERLVIENIISAKHNGAVVKNYTRVEKIEERNGFVVVSARGMRSAETSEFRARVLLNAAGPWVDMVRRSGGIDARTIIHPTKGVHLVLPKLSEQALFVSSRDGRMFFIIPLESYSLIGTTDTKYDGDLDEVHADTPDIDYLLRESRRILPGLLLGQDAILYTYAGVRPLAFSGERESSISRKHLVIKEGMNGRLITIAGGKLTTYRNMAEDAVDAVCKLLGCKKRCITDTALLPGSLPVSYDEYLKDAVASLSSKYNAEADTVMHLIRFYGSRAEEVLEIAHIDPRLMKRISPESRDIYAQVVYSVREEAAQTLADVILRRLSIGITASRGLPYARDIASVLAKELGWHEEELSLNLKEFETLVQKDRAF